MTKGNCAHQQFEKSNLGSRVKYGKTGAATVPDGTKYVIKELKPPKKQAQAAANRTARITGIRTYGYVWTHLGDTRFSFQHVVTSRTGTTKYRISSSKSFRFGPLPAIGGGGGAVPWNILGVDPARILEIASTTETVEWDPPVSDWSLTQEAWGFPVGPINIDGLTPAEEVWLADVPAIEGEWPVPTPDSLEIMKRQEERGGYGTEPPVIT